MKLYLLFIIIGITLLWDSTSLAVYDGTLGADNGVNTNPHNLSSQSGNSKKAASLGPFPPPANSTIDRVDTQICIFCHTPHSARSVAPLWGRPDSTATFGIRANLKISDPAIVNTTLYSTTADYPNGATKVCLSCHDGVTAMGIFANWDEITMIGGNALRIDLTTSHPVSFVYDSVVRNYLESQSPGYQPWSNVYLDSADRVQCTTCHQPHQDTQGFGGGIYPFWRVGSGSLADYNTVCNSCHTSTPSIPTLPGTKEHEYN